MLVTIPLVNKIIKTTSEYFRLKKLKKKEKFSGQKTVDTTIDLTADIVTSVLILILLLMEIFLIVFLLVRTLREVPPSSERTVKIILIVLMPELYGLFYMFLQKRVKRPTATPSFSMKANLSSSAS